MNTNALVAKALRNVIGRNGEAVVASYPDAVDKLLQVETIVTQLEAGLVPVLNRNDIAAALEYEGVTRTTAAYVLRVLAKLGVL